ncbi:MAG: response regulator [Spartobacteria bacterium]|nr:response regulator [Spartobacteria bacterium]
MDIATETKTHEHTPDPQSVNILIVEDDRGHAALIRKGFDASSYRGHVKIVETIAEAKTCISGHPPTLLITDLRLPDGHGTELLAGRGEPPAYPVAVITSHGNEESAVEAMKAGAIDYIVKSSETLVDMPHIAGRVLREWNSLLERNYMRAQLIHADKLASLGILVAGVAHEVNNPNSFIMLNVPNLADIWGDVFPVLEAYCADKGITKIGFSELDELREIVPKLLSDMLLGSERINRIITDLKNFARPDHTGIMSSIDINEVVTTATSLTRNKLKNSTQHLDIRLDETGARITGNYFRIEQVIINLLLNACDALPDPSCAIRITTLADYNRRVCALTVEDEGCGISKDDIAQVRTAFFTTKQTAGGLGLGLTISSQIVKEHSGTMTIESTPGKGATVTIELPMEPGTPMS